MLILKVTLGIAQHDSIQTENHDRSRKVEFILNNEPIQLNRDFKIHLFLNLNRLELRNKELNIVNLPDELSPDSIYSAVFIYKSYELIFDKVQGDNLGYNTVWTFRINTLFNNDNLDNNSWAFSPIDKDGWMIYAKAWRYKK